MITAASSAACLAGKIGASPIIFTCPFCDDDISFKANDENAIMNCPSCNELVKVTTDPKVHEERLKSWQENSKLAEDADYDIDLEDANDYTGGSINPFGDMFIAPKKIEDDDQKENE
ncbi:MAG: hypothetical protein HRT89_12950 [Lentisphaeria bacterium]|nr:hypothetical protein [Lentisphaeria bacterium]NQZ68967.1 hypothetical protein [Lentisphaeria bacterium]